MSTTSVFAQPPVEEPEPEPDSGSSSGHVTFSTTPDCVCLPPQDQFHANETSTTGRRIIGQAATERAATNICTSAVNDFKTECKRNIITAITTKVRASCVLSVKIDEECSTEPCRAVDSRGLPNPGSITINTPICTVSEQASGRWSYSSAGQVQCSFAGTIDVLCDP